MQLPPQLSAARFSFRPYCSGILSVGIKPLSTVKILVNLAHIRERSLFLTAILIASLFCPVQDSRAQPVDTSDWVELRRLESAALRSLAESDGDSAGAIRAHLTLASRALNLSVETSARHLAAAEALAQPGTDEAAFALAVRCQLEHRQILPEATQTCGRLLAQADDAESALVRAYRHWTLNYYHYREGNHDLALKAAKTVLSLAEPLEDHDLLAAAHNMVGLHFATRFRPRLSIVHFETALEHARQMVMPQYRYLIQLNLASSYTYLGFGQKALDLLREVQMTPLVELYPTRELVVASMVAQAKVAAGELAGVETSLQQTIDALQETVLPDGVTFGYTGLGVVQLADDRPEDALRSFERVLEITGKDFDSGLQHPRIQMIAVPYAVTLRELGRVDEARELLGSIVASVPDEQPDQLAVSAMTELATTLRMSGDRRATRSAAEKAARLRAQLIDEDVSYRMARLNVSLELDRQKAALELAQAREAALRAVADREEALKHQSWLLGSLAFVVVVLLFSRLLQRRIARTERAANERLEGQVEERTRELSQEMAQRVAVEVERRELSEKLADGEKMRVVGQLTAGVAHDFNNLMSIVSLSAENLRFGVANGETLQVEKAIDDILSAADSGAKITEGLLAYVRKQPLRPETVALDEFLEHALPMFRNTLTERIRLSTYFEPCHAKVDKGQLTSSLLNIVLNAKDAMPDGGSLSLELRAHDNTANIVVADTGVGMNEETRRNAFEPFFSTKESGEGTGLGLSMVYGFARQSGGDLTLDSTEGKGTRVTLSLPLIQEAPQIEEHTPASSRGRGAIRVLAIEDREHLLETIRQTLTNLGLQVDTAPNADIALRVIEERGVPELLISDVMLPGSMDGQALATKLRERTPALPVVLISGCAESVDPAFVFLPKPFSTAQLEVAIRAAMTPVT